MLRHDYSAVSASRIDFNASGNFSGEAKKTFDYVRAHGLKNFILESFFDS